MAAHILRDLGVTSVVLMTADTAKLNCLKAHGIKVSEQLPPLPVPHAHGAAVAISAAAVVTLDSSGGCGSSKKGGRKGAEPHFV